MPDRLYLDHAATTPLLPEARAAMARGFEIWANASSPHAEGRSARAALEAARREIASALDWDGHVLLTSGASEAIAIAIGLTTCRHRAVSSIEHDAVLRAAGDCERLSVDANGVVVLPNRSFEATLVAIQSANSETGVIQPLQDLRAKLRSGSGAMFVDASQSAGKLPLPDANLIAVSAHKLGGPPGIGALLVRDLALLLPVGGQEQGYRPGTENLPAALGFAAALSASREWMTNAAALRARLDGAIEASGGQVVARDAARIPTVASYRMPGVSAASQLIRFDLAGMAVSAGSACSSGSLKPSHVLTAMGWGPSEAAEVVRVSFGPQTCAADIDRFIDEWRRIAASAQARAV